MELMRHLRRHEDGFVVVLAVVVMGLMLGLGLAALSMTDTQQRKSRHERERESSFNLAEGALQQQGYVLGGGGWPISGGAAPPASCTIGAISRFCPTTANLANSTGTATYNTPDYRPGSAASPTTAITWTTYIRDNVAAGNRTYSSAVDTTPCSNGGGAAPCTWDANGDGLIWVRSVATVRGRTRTLVALLKREAVQVKLTPTVVIAGSLAVGHNGNKTVIFTDSSHPPIVRCTNVNSTSCVDYLHDGKKDDQIIPAYVKSDPGLGSYLDTDTLNLLLSGSHPIDHCPSPAEAQGFVVVDAGNVTCDLGPPDTVPAQYNTPGDPGMIIMKRGVLKLSGSPTYYGVILHLNQDNVSGARNPVVDIVGNWTIVGSVVIEGNGAFSITGSAIMRYDTSVFGSMKVTGAAGLVQDTWRELFPGA
jgi:Tfp pilus assembly protein PilX